MYEKWFKEVLDILMNIKNNSPHNVVHVTNCLCSRREIQNWKRDSFVWIHTVKETSWILIFIMFAIDENKIKKRKLKMKCNRKDYKAHVCSPVEMKRKMNKTTDHSTKNKTWLWYIFLIRRNHPGSFQSLQEVRRDIVDLASTPNGGHHWSMWLMYPC